MATITTQERTNILKLVAGMFNAAPGAAYLSEFTTAYQAMGSNLNNLATALGNTGAFKSLYPSSLTSAEFATKFLTTLGLQANTDAVAWVQAKVNAGQSFASVIVQAVSALDATSEAQFASAKALLANKASVAEYYSVPAPVGVGVSSDNLATLQGVVAKVTADTASVQTAKDAIVGGGNGQSFTLTTGQDVFNGTAGADIIRGVAGQAVGAQDQSTFNSSDILDGGAGEDRLVINMTGANYAGGATVKNIETLQIGSNLAAAQFEYNVNQGAYEITGVNTVIYDQITVGETLNVVNVTPTAATASNPIPVLSWENEAGSLAGVAGVTYRQATIAGTADNQVVNLKNVNNGQLNIANGIETLTINSLGTAARNTLLNSANADTGTNAVAADLISGTSLTKVVLNATTELGKVGGRAADGTTNRVATDGVGDGLTGTAANLLSVGARVTTVDASASTAAVNVQFVAKTDGAATNVAFTGGKGNDYVEFEVGNVNANGGDGNDTFAFVTQRAGVTNSTFGAGDTIVGGAGTDTIQIGSNGVGTYTIADSEWANKSGIEVVDLRGATNTVTLSSAFVAATDAGVKLTVTTDAIVVGGNSNAEYNSVNTIDLRTLSAGQGIKFVGGQGSDRIILSDTTFTSNMELAGGSNVDANGNATAGHYDTLTVSNSAVLDRTDLANVSGFEGLVLNKTVTGAVTNVIELTEAFLLANTSATNSVTTTIDDRVFQIGTAAGANGTALAAGDTVRIDVTDLFTTNNNTVKTTVVGRQIDVTTLVNAGVAVQYVYNGTTYANLAALTAAVATVGGNAVLTGADAAGQTDVVGAGVGLGTPNTGITFTSSAIAAQNNVLGTNNNDVFNLSKADTINGGTGSDTVNFNAGSEAANVTLGGGADTVNLNGGILTGTLNMAAGGTVNITSNLGGAFNFNTPTVTFGAATTVNVTAVQAGAITNENGAGHTLNATVGGTFILGSGGQTFTSSGTGNVLAGGGAGDDTLTLSNTGASTVAGGNGIDTINITAATGATTVVLTAGAGGGAAALAVNRDVVTGFNATNDVIGLVAADTVPAGVAGTTPVVQSVAAAGAVAISNTADVVVLNFDLGGTTAVLAGVLDGSALLANLGGALTTTAATDIGYIVAYDNGNAYVYSYDADLGTNDTAVTANEIALIATFNGVATGSLGVANFALV